MAWAVAAGAALTLAACSTVGLSGEDPQADGWDGMSQRGSVMTFLTSGNGDDAGSTGGPPAFTLTGGLVGHYVDQQQAELTARLRDSGVTLMRVGENLILNTPGKLTFKTDSRELQPAFFEILNSVTAVLASYNHTNVEIIGHTDSDGGSQYNQALSEQRARNVARYLESKGISPMRMTVIGYGELHPIATNDTKKGRQQNRRIELALMPIID
jgi:outer membrane protein OmpA-like peptidoglycan-associated protein